MAVTYQKVPITLDPFTPIPADALPSAGLDDADADLVVQASADYTTDTAVGVAVGFTAANDVEVTLSPADAFEEDFAIDWDWGDGTQETGHDLLQAHHYLSDGAYSITAVVRQLGEASFALSVPVSIPGEPPVVP